MEQKQKSPVLKRIISLIFLLLWMGLIFYLSNQTATESSAVSKGLIRTVLNFIFPNMSTESLAALTSRLQFIVRKGAHFSLYAVLGVLSFLTFITYTKIPLALRTVISSVIGILYAVSDEYHQTFISGRSGELRDICIDSCGVITGVIFSFLVFILYRSIKNRKGSVMKKKQLIELTETLRLHLNKANSEIDEYKKENASLKEELLDISREIEQLRMRLCEMEDSINNNTTTELQGEDVKTPDPIPEIQEDIPCESGNESPISENIPEINLTDDVTYGSQIIGKVVLSATKNCNDLTYLPSSENTRELINLILGRAEVAKSEILRIVALDIDHQSKIVAMEKELREAEDYFKSVMAQK